MTLKGRRRRSAERGPNAGKLPRGIRRGDYWRASTSTGEPTNLTGLVWWLAAPMPTGGYALGRLVKHTVREEPDGTISVRPGDGSSNSILMRGANDQEFHGYVEHGVWRSV